MSVSLPENITLSRPDLFLNQDYEAEAWVGSFDGEYFEVTNPANGDVLTHLPNLGADATRKAINLAEKAQKEWAKVPGKSRALILRKLFDLMMANSEDLSKILTLEMGKPLSQARDEIAYGAGFVEFMGEEAKRIYGDTIPAPTSHNRILVLKQPVGVVAAITPWNFPCAMVTRKMAPALAAGCAIVLKPAPETPLSALAIAKLAEQAGLPKGLFCVVTSKKSREVGLEMCENESVRKLTFTGSTPVGRVLMQQCSGTLKKLGLELGGNAPFIVFDDADLDKAVQGAVIAKFRNAGQTCVCANRLYVQAGIYDAFCEKLVQAVHSLKLGEGFEDGVKVGPLINQAAVDKMHEHIDDAVSRGAHIFVGGEVDMAKGTNFFKPTVLSDVPQDAIVAKDETFGPLAPLFKFDTVDDVIEMANDTEFGLASYFYARDVSQIFKVVEALEYGIVGVNTGAISTEVAPFGGIKQSGFGREGSKYGLEDFMELKYVNISVG